MANRLPSRELILDATVFLFLAAVLFLAGLFSSFDFSSSVEFMLLISFSIMVGYGVVAPIVRSNRQKTKEENDLIYSSFRFALIFLLGTGLMVMNAAFSLGTIYGYELWFKTSAAGYVTVILSLLAFAYYYIRLRYTNRPSD